MAGPYKLDSLIVLTYLKHIKIHTNVNIKRWMNEIGISILIEAGADDCSISSKYVIRHYDHIGNSCNTTETVMMG